MRKLGRKRLERYYKREGHENLGEKKEAEGIRRGYEGRRGWGNWGKTKWKISEWNETINRRKGRGKLGRNQQ